MPGDRRIYDGAMSDALRFDILDLVLILGVSMLVTVVAFVHRPRVKALVFSFPVPFALANLSLGEPISATHAAGLLNLLLFLNVVRWLHAGARIAIVPTIAIAAGLYIAVGAGLHRMIPNSTPAFWLVFAVVIAVAITLLAVMKPRLEPGHRSELAIPVKFAAVAGVVAVIVALKGVLGGFMTTFPLAGVVTVYESRRSLWTLSRQGPLLILALGSMMVAMRLGQTLLGLTVPASLLPGLAVWAAVMAPITFLRWRAEDAAG